MGRFFPWWSHAALVFNVTGRESELSGAVLLGRFVNATTERINLSNQSNEIDVKVPIRLFGSRVERKPNLLIMVTPHVTQDHEE